jgi:hypothetical protein
MVILMAIEAAGDEKLIYATNSGLMVTSYILALKELFILLAISNFLKS